MSSDLQLDQDLEIDDERQSEAGKNNQISVQNNHFTKGLNCPLH